MYGALSPSEMLESETLFPLPHHGSDYSDIYLFVNGVSHLDMLCQKYETCPALA